MLGGEKQMISDGDSDRISISSQPPIVIILVVTGSILVFHCLCCCPRLWFCDVCILCVVSILGVVVVRDAFTDIYIGGPYCNHGPGHPSALVVVLVVALVITCHVVIDATMVLSSGS